MNKLKGLLHAVLVYVLRVQIKLLALLYYNYTRFRFWVFTLALYKHVTTSGYYYCVRCYWKYCQKMNVIVPHSTNLPLEEQKITIKQSVSYSMVQFVSHIPRFVMTVRWSCPLLVLVYLNETMSHQIWALEQRCEGWVGWKSWCPNASSLNCSLNCAVWASFSHTQCYISAEMNYKVSLYLR